MERGRGFLAQSDGRKTDLLLKSWETLPEALRTEEVRPYYERLRPRKAALLFKRLMDIVLSVLLLVLLSPFMLIIAAAIKLDSKGPVFFRQVRVTQYGREFRIFKFRTMVQDAEQKGSRVTVLNDDRITRVGARIRRLRLDEIPQLLNVLTGDMSFVGARPEVPKYVAQYTPTMMATLLLPAGITSLASIRFKDEDALLQQAETADEVYVRDILPQKMKYNLAYLQEFTALKDIGLLFQTAFHVLGLAKESPEENEARETKG